MTKNRLEAFSDGVIAIIITIMVLELGVPHAPELAALIPLIPIFLSYVLSFVIVGMWWNNHHHLLHAVKQIDGRVLWANMLLLFWLSLFPFTTAWMGENNFAATPVAIYGGVLLLAAISYNILVRVLISIPANEGLAHALGSDLKGKISIGLYAVAIPLAFVSPWISCALYVAVAIIWFIPDRRIEQNVER